MLVVDKTVPETDYREHRAIYWVAEHRHFINPDGSFYDHEKDYLGYHPTDGRQELITEELLENHNLLYLADTYGIYDYEEGLKAYEEKLPYQHQDIELLYGGLSLDEVEAIKKYAGNANNILIGEHNIFGYPTYLNPEASLTLQNIFGVRYSGWLTRYYSDLDEAAFWLKERYSQIYGQQWDLAGPGMVFVREEVPALNWQRDLVIVTDDKFDGPWPVLSDSDHRLTEGASRNIPYLYWVEILEVIPEADILTYYELPLKEEALTALRIRGLPEHIPAVVHYTPPDRAERIYFAGDFADQLPAMLPARLIGSARIQRLMTYLPGLPVEYRFYFQWYEPVITNILHEAGSETEDVQ